MSYENCLSLQDTYWSREMLKLILLIVIVQIISNDASPFPEDMYHGKNLTMQNFLRTQELQTTPKTLFISRINASQM